VSTLPLIATHATKKRDFFANCGIFRNRSNSLVENNIFWTMNLFFFAESLFRKTRFRCILILRVKALTDYIWAWIFRINRKIASTHFFKYLTRIFEQYFDFCPKFVEISRTICQKSAKTVPRKYDSNLAQHLSRHFHVYFW